MDDVVKRILVSAGVKAASKLCEELEALAKKHGFEFSSEHTAPELQQYILRDIPDTTGEAEASVKFAMPDPSIKSAPSKADEKKKKTVKKKDK